MGVLAQSLLVHDPLDFDLQVHEQCVEGIILDMAAAVSGEGYSVWEQEWRMSSQISKDLGKRPRKWISFCRYQACGEAWLYKETSLFLLNLYVIIVFYMQTK